jgi:hypothetical protein
MNLNEGTTQAPNEGPSNITALPELTEVEKLQAQVVELEALRRADADVIEEASRKVRDLTKHRDVLQKRVDEAEKNPLSFALLNMDEGGALLEGGELLQGLTDLVMKRQGKGVFTMTIKVKPFQGGSLIMEPDFKTTEPKLEPTKSVFWKDDSGALTRQNTKQREFEFGEGRTTREDRAMAEERRHPENR